MEPNLEQTMALLSRTPAALDALLRDLPESWTKSNEGGQSWSPLEIIAHLAYIERSDWISRAQRLLEFGESRPFDSVIRTGFAEEIDGKSLGDRLDEFAHLRAANVSEIRSWKLRPEELAKRGTHPALGTVTLSQLLATWAAHDLTHLHQISRVMAYQYRDAVGPWSKFLGVLKCEGHGG